MHLSRIQFYASSMLDFIEQSRLSKREDKELRLAMLALEGVNYAMLFPELAPTTDDDDILEGTDTDNNAIATKYIFTDAELDPKKVEEEIAEMLARAAEGSATFNPQIYSDWI